MLADLGAGDDDELVAVPGQRSEPGQHALELLPLLALAGDVGELEEHAHAVLAAGRERLGGELQRAALLVVDGELTSALATHLEHEAQEPRDAVLVLVGEQADEVLALQRAEAEHLDHVQGRVVDGSVVPEVQRRAARIPAGSAGGRSDPDLSGLFLYLGSGGLVAYHGGDDPIPGPVRPPGGDPRVRGGK